MNVIQRHAKAIREQLAGARLLAIALKKRIRYMGLTVRHIWDLPTLFAVQQQGIQYTDEAVGKLHMELERMKKRIQHHERGPLMASARLLQRRQGQAEAIARKLAEAKTDDDVKAAERAAAQLASDLEADGMPPADVEIDGQNGQVLEHDKKLITEPMVIGRIRKQ